MSGDHGADVPGETAVAIIGAGPAGLVLSHLLARAGIDTVVLERRDRDYVERRVRAGVLEHPSVELLRDLGLAGRLDAVGLQHRGVELAFGGERHRVDFIDLVGRSITVYGQQEIVKDLIAARLAAGLPAVFEAEDVEPSDLEAERPVVRYTVDGDRRELRCRFVAGCDGFHGIARSAVDGLHPGGVTVYDRQYPFGWLGVLAEAPPTTDELIYSAHERGFALYSMRSPAITRLYLQVPADTDSADWSADRVWDELQRRLPTDAGFALATGPILEQSVTAIRGFVATPMRAGRLLLAGDAAHIVPPTGAKGMNLAIADAVVAADVIVDALRTGCDAGLAAYTDACLPRVWRAQHFSYWMTTMLHRLDADPYQRQLQLSQLAHVTSSRAAATDLAQNYAGFPFARWEPAP